MDEFLRRFGDKVIGVLHGFDRLRFRGSIRGLCYPQGMIGFLWRMQVLLKDFGAFAKDTTNTLCQAIESRAQEMDLPAIYLASSNEDKEKRALANAQEKGLSTGPIAVLSCVEPCRSCDVGYEAETKKLVPILKDGKCLHYYHYYLDPHFGLMYTRLQSWFPFTMHIGLNGRDWLAAQMRWRTSITSSATTVSPTWGISPKPSNSWTRKCSWIGRRSWRNGPRAAILCT
jgi:hypothetical protein